jgi:ABC-2 type transport system ATP-binding protein
VRIDIVELRKYYGSTRAVDGISFRFGAGQIFGFVGPNGAGKSTTLRILATLDDPTDGDVLLDGVSLIEEPEKAHKLIGYVPDSLPTHSDISVHEYLDFFARAYGIRNPRRTKVVEDIEEFTNLVGIRDKHLNALSKGMKNRVSVARALVHDPAVLVMDEPAAGLDPRARIELRELLKVLASQGKAILISSHILTELAEICTGAIFIERGRILRAGTLEQLMAQDTPHRSLVIRCLPREGEAANPPLQEGEQSRTTAAARSQEEMLKYLLQLPSVLEAKLVDHAVEVELVGTEETCFGLLISLLENGHRVVEFRQRRADLEQIFMNVTKGEVQ